MIYSARPTVSPVANIVFYCFVFARFEMWERTGGGGGGRTDHLGENN